MLRETTETDYRARIRRVLAHIQTHLDDPLDLEGLARIAHFSPWHFHRVFRGMTGESVAEHVRRLRLERAAVHLKLSDRSIVRLAFEAGYETHESFLRAFRARFGMNPSVYRRTRVGVPVAATAVLPDMTQPNGGSLMDVQIKHFEPMRVAAVRHTGPYRDCGAAWNRLMAWAGPRGLAGPDAFCLGISYDDPDVTPADKLRYDACIRVAADVAGEGDVVIMEVAGGDYAMVLHRGSYEGLAEKYYAICGQWAPASGRELGSAPPFEVYLNCVDTTPEEDLLTEVYVSLADA